AIVRNAKTAPSDTNPGVASDYCTIAITDSWVTQRNQSVISRMVATVSEFGLL
ncbi:hypothetical protein BgiBS90_033870, partial [Biomphalaria glabrata]